MLGDAAKHSNLKPTTACDNLHDLLAGEVELLFKLMQPDRGALLSDMTVACFNGQAVSERGV